MQVTFWTAQTGGTQLSGGKQTNGAPSSCPGPSNNITSPSPDAYTVTLANGVFSQVVQMCASDFNNVFPDSTNGTWIQVESTIQSDMNFSTSNVVTYPRQQFSAAPYAFKVPVDVPR